MQYLVGQRLPVSRIIVEGLKAPLRHPTGLLLSSAMWVAAAFLFDDDVSRHYLWTEAAGAGREMRSAYASFSWIALALKSYAFASFFISWTRGLYFKEVAAAEFHLLRYDRRLWWLFRDCFKLSFGLAVIGIPVMLLLLGLSSISQAVGGLLLLLGSIWLCCRLAVFATAIAIGEEPESVVDAIDPTKGNAARIFVAMVPLIALVTALKGLANALYGYLNGGILFFNFRFASDWYDVYPGPTVPLWMVGVETLFDWLFYAWAIATLTEIYRYLTPKRATDESVVGVF